MLKKLFILIFSTVLLASNICNANTNNTTTDKLKNKTVNFQIDPIPLLINIASVDLNFFIGEKVTIGPTLDFLYANPFFLENEFDLSYYSIGVKTQYFFGESAISDSWLLSIPASYGKIKVTDKKSHNKSAKLSAMGISILGGYQWHWDTFNIQLLGGLSITNFGKASFRRDDGSEVEAELGHLRGVAPAVSFALGWSF